MSKYIPAFLVTILLLVAGLVFWPRSSNQDVSEVLRQLRLRLQREPAAAWSQAQALLREYPDDERVFAAVADIAAEGAGDEQWHAFVGQYRERLQLCTHADDVVIDRMIRDGYLQTAESLLAAALQQDPGSVSALQAMSELLLLEGRQEAARIYLRRLLRQNSIPVELLVFLSSRREVYEDRAALHEAQRREPFAGVLAGLAAIAASENNFIEAVRLFEQAIEAGPDDPASWAGLGLSLYRSGASDRRLIEWRERVRERGVVHSDISFLLGAIEERAGDNVAAVQHLCAAMERTPLHRSASQMLGTVLQRDAKTRDAGTALVVRAAAVDELELLMHDVLFGERNAEDLVRAARLCGELGESDIALAWLSGAVAFAPSGWNSPLSREELMQISQAAAERFTEALQVAVNARPAASAKADTVVSGATDTQLRLIDRSAELGLTIPYHGGVSDLENGLWIYQGFGGGVGVFDVDGDDRPDLYLTQACNWPSPDQLPLTQQDLIYRNIRAGFEQINDSAAPAESAFGQGVAVGDVNADGFDDLYVANIGANRLLISNGDGTFQNVDLPGDDWTSSCLMADLNGDGLDDLFDVCYLSGSEPFERICRTGGDQTRVRSCLPSLFDPAADRIRLSRGDGQWEDISAASGLQAATGRGLGVIAADIDGQPGLELFISNDLSANHYWTIQWDRPVPQFAEVAEVHGLARNGEGQLEACMGIAAADFSQDGRLDFLVTNFLNETNTLYESMGGGFYRDRSEASRLAMLSRSQLGFGVQPLDADLDGDFDVVIANGHVDDYSHLGAAFRMKVDVFENQSGSVFRKCPPRAAGDYGERPVLGRAMARIDWNQDGRDDLAITHLDRPPALLENQTPPVARFVSLKLIGVESNRPAVGTIVRVKSGDTEFVLQQMAGDGYYCSSERRLQLGGFREERVSEITVEWPSGRSTTLRDVPTNARLTLIEGRESFYRLTP